MGKNKNKNKNHQQATQASKVIQPVIPVLTEEQRVEIEIKNEETQNLVEKNQADSEIQLNAEEQAAFDKSVEAVRTLISTIKL